MLKILQDAGVVLKVKRCSFFVVKVNYLGHDIRIESLEITETTTKVIQDFSKIKMKRKVRFCVGTCSFFQHSVCNITKI